MKYKIQKIVSLIALANAAVFTQAEESIQIAQLSMEEMLVTGGKEDIKTLSGSAHLLDEEELEKFDFVDLNQVLSTLPGVYIRQEDGYGLRPNIGLRGVTSERSQKITLMEDGVLIKPAPYSAPAAYYIPNISRMSAIEVVKGPASIKQGPNNVGGAINLVTQPVPEDAEGFVDLGVGSDGYRKYQGFYGDTLENFGYWIDALHFGSDGFKELDGGGDTGFERNDINAKLQWTLDDLFGYEQLITLKFGYADEKADETYLGLTQEDFDADPNRRYAASQLARFESEHSQVHFEHGIAFSDEVSLNTKLYWNSFDRFWNKVDGFVGEGFSAEDGAFEANGISLRTVFADPGSYQNLLGVLRGERDSSGSEDTLDITKNDRSYGSHGVQFKLSVNTDFAGISHKIESGIRYHHDYIERDHSTRGYLMTDGVLVNDGIDYGNKTLNEAETDALALYINDTMIWGDWTFNAGLRYEDIESEATDFLSGGNNDKSQSIVVPGAGAFWQFTDKLGFLVGVNKGFSPAGSTAGPDVDPEEATNYEYGLRYEDEDLSVELIGFFSDYKNLLGRCRASDSGCNVGEEFNGGRVEVAGAELYGQYILPIDSLLSFPINFSYTYTESAFQESFVSSFSQWGNVIKGDRLPYLPEHVGRVQLGVEADDWDALIAVSYQSEMLDQAGRDEVATEPRTDAYTVVDVSSSWQINPSWLVQLSVDNLLDEEAVVSWRPFGARGIRPRTARARVKYSF